MNDVSNQNVLYTLNQRAHYFSKSLNASLKEYELFSSQ